jgi:diaminopimelate decarboxylase
MDSFVSRDGSLFCEDVPVEKLAEEYGTPLYVYSKATILDHFNKIKEAFQELDPVICFAVKANGNLSVLKTLAEAGAGFDLVSGGELFRVLKSGGNPGKAVFAGVGKTAKELDEALAAEIMMFNCESEPELDAIEAAAVRAGKQASIALRINPNVKAGGHQKISTGHKEAKFGLTPQVASRILAEADRWPHLLFDGVHVHIGSQITSPDPYTAALDRVVAFVKGNRSDQTPLTWINTGGGFGVFYKTDNEASSAQAFADVIIPRVKDAQCKLILEPGRFIVANAGVLLTRVLYVKDTGNKRYYIVDAAMNDLIRPALYDSFHEIWPTESNLLPPSRGGSVGGATLCVADVVGPICETGDVLAAARPLPAIATGQLLSIFSAGAYGFTMASNYNGRSRPAEILVDGKDVLLARKRETYDSLIAGEVF